MHGSCQAGGGGGTAEEGGPGHPRNSSQSQQVRLRAQGGGPGAMAARLARELGSLCQHLTPVRPRGCHVGVRGLSRHPSQGCPLTALPHWVSLRTTTLGLSRDPKDRQGQDPHGWLSALRPGPPCQLGRRFPWADTSGPGPGLGLWRAAEQAGCAGQPPPLGFWRLTLGLWAFSRWSGGGGGFVCCG